VSSDGRTLYVATGRGKQLVRLHARALRFTGTVKVGERPWCVSASPDGKHLFVANCPLNDASMIDAATLPVVARIPAAMML
jgi:YVTN family beta-propeller protein